MERGKIERGIQRARDGGREGGLDVESESERDWAKWTDLTLSSDEPRHPFPRWIISAPLNQKTTGAKPQTHGKLLS